MAPKRAQDGPPAGTGPRRAAPAETEAWLERLALPLRVPARALADLVRESVPDAEERVAWGVPMWRVPGGEDFCYLHARRDDVGLGFQRGRMLDDPRGRLVALGNARDARHLRMGPGEDVPAGEARAFVVQAAALARRPPR